MNIKYVWSDGTELLKDDELPKEGDTLMSVLGKSEKGYDWVLDDVIKVTTESEHSATVLVERRAKNQD